MNTAHPLNVKPAPRPVFAGATRGSFLDHHRGLDAEPNQGDLALGQLMPLIEGPRCVAGNEFAVEVALREARSKCGHFTATGRALTIWLRFVVAANEERECG